MNVKNIVQQKFNDDEHYKCLNDTFIQLNVSLQNKSINWFQNSTLLTTNFWTAV